MINGKCFTTRGVINNLSIHCTKPDKGVGTVMPKSINTIKVSMTLWRQRWCKARGQTYVATTLHLFLHVNCNITVDLHRGVGKWGVSSDYAEVPVSLVKWAGLR